MITKMTKYDFIVHHSDYDDFLLKLRQTGVVHIATLQQGTEAYESLRDKYTEQQHTASQIELCQQLIDLDHKTKQKNGQPPTVPSITTPNLTLQQGRDIASQFDELQKQQEQLLQEKNSIQREIQRMLPWGDFSRESIDRLTSSGQCIEFFTCQQRAWSDTWLETYNAFIINTVGSTIYFVTINPQPVVGIEAETFIFSDKDSAQLNADYRQAATQCSEHNEVILQFAARHLADLQQLSALINDNITLDRIHINTIHAADDAIMVLEGYCPDGVKNQLDTMLATEGIYYQASEPEAEDCVPIKLHNNRFTRMFESLTGMYGMPIYQEFDPTPILAPFFLLFFAMCMGDAGYGLILILFGLGLKSGKIRMSMFDGLGPIITTLGVGTAVIGFFLGTAFGIDLYSASWMPQSLKSVMIKGEVAGFDIQMILAIVIGVFHLCLAMTVKAIGYTKRWGFAKSICTWGWLLLIVGGISTVLLAVGSLISAEAAQYVLIAIGAISALGIYIFNDTKRNVFINIGAGLWDTYNMATGLLGDTLSYIRLYALGLAGGMLGGAFNNLGAMILGDEPSILLYIPYVLILILGHTLNLAMSALGAFVHPLRLTFVEYFKNAGYEGKGEKYTPFAKTA